MPMSYQCMNCKHYEGGYKEGPHCKAFPEGGQEIPYEIINGSHDHTKEYKGDNGIRYEPISKKLDKLISDDV